MQSPAKKIKKSMGNTAAIQNSEGFKNVHVGSKSKVETPPGMPVSQSPPRVMKERLVIGEHPLVKFDPSEKQAWRMILSFLSFEDLLVVAAVCKSFFFILKEDERFWKKFCENNYGSRTLPEECNSWKHYFFVFHAMEWDESRFVQTNFELNPADKKVIRVTASSNWLAALTKNELCEGILYCFDIVNLST